jgi:hypothetical protein
MSFSFAYTTPANLCGELYHRLYPELHALRTGGDMRNFRPGRVGKAERPRTRPGASPVSRVAMADLLRAI